MKAAVWHGRKDVRVEEVPDPPPPPPGQIQIEVAWCGICGTDLHEYLGGPLYISERVPHPLTGAKAPQILGHELSGRVIAIGRGVKGFSLRDRVAACPIIGCLECRWCKAGFMGQCDKVAFLGISWHGGGFAEKMNLYAYQAYHLPDAVSDEVGSLVEPFAATTRMVARAEVGPNDNVAVVGAGPIGLMALTAARIAGAKRVVSVELAERRIELAKKCGATAVINPAVEDPFKTAKAITDGDGFDIVLECVGQPQTGLLAGRLTRTRGKLMVMGVFEEPAPLDWTDIVYGEKTIVGSMGGYGLFEKAIADMANPQFPGGLLITGRIGLDDILEKGFRPLIEEKDKHVKILVSPKL